MLRKSKRKRKKVTDKKPAVLKAQPVNFSGAKNFQLFNGKTVGRAGGGNTNFTAYLIEQNKNFVQLKRRNKRNLSNKNGISLIDGTSMSKTAE